MDYYLSKTDFKLARTCATKLFYKKHNYTPKVVEDDYMEMLADGGYMIGKMAQLLYPEGIEIEGTTNECITKTESLLGQENVTLFEAAILSNHKLIRVDILKKSGSRIELIEVKSGSFDSEIFCKDVVKGAKNLKPEYIEDIAFQDMVFREGFPAYEVHSFLLMPDKSKTTNIDQLITWFEMREVQESKTFRKVVVDFAGNADQLRTDHILSWLNVDAIIAPMAEEIKQSAINLVQSLAADTKIQAPLGLKCKSCEYRLENHSAPLNGFAECWGANASQATILDLGYGGNFNRKGEIDALIKHGKVQLSDVDIESVRGKYNNRIFFQLTEPPEFLDAGFREAIDAIQYPLHFVDFETSQMAIPYHAGMHPYEKVMFQWSCHTISQVGAEPKHSEWINTKLRYPNIEFASSLKSLIGYDGTIMTWSPYENTQLKSIHKYMVENKHHDTELIDWLSRVAQITKDDDTMIVDMNKLAIAYYFHPLMGARTSIKVTLPAVLKSTKSKQIAKWLNDDGLLATDEKGFIVNPYKQLPTFEIFDTAERINDGGGAMCAYQDMMYGKYRNNTAIKEEYKQALLRYCKLDTLAMVIIWEHWREMGRR